jgi:hypothetical protein
MKQKPGALSHLRLEAGLLWRWHSAAHRNRQLEWATRLCARLSCLGRLCVWQGLRWSRRTTCVCRAAEIHSGRAAQSGQSRARHLRFRRLLPVSRRHDRLHSCAHGRKPKAYFGDSSRPERHRSAICSEEALRVYRSRVINPKWIESIKRHGYKGGLELAATVDYIFGFDATAQIAPDFVYEGLAEHYALSQEMRDFLAPPIPGH